jgi:chromosomal replication initiator protein
VDVLVVGDIQELANRPKTQSEFLNIIKNLKSKGAQIILSSDKAPSDLLSIEKRILTRLSSFLLIDLKSPALETRIEILKKYAKRQSLELDESIIQTIAQKYSNNIRELEGAILKLVAHSRQLNTKVDLELVRKILKR